MESSRREGDDQALMEELDALETDARRMEMKRKRGCSEENFQEKKTGKTGRMGLASGDRIQPSERSRGLET